MLVAHPEGELFRRAREGTDLIPLAPRNEVDLTAGWRLSRILRDLGPDVVHAHDPHAVAMSGLALSFKTLSPKPLLVASRRVDFHLQAHSFSRWKYRQVEVFIAASEAIRAVLVHDGIPASRVAVVHDGIDVERIAHLPIIDMHAEFWLPHGAPVVVNVGALVAHKGQKHLIDAMSQVLRQLPDAHAIVFGEGELRGALEKQIKERRLEKHVILAGFREDVLSLVKSADLFVMSSLTEGLGSTVLDAMAMKLAVVGTRAGGIPEAVVPGETGLLVAPGDPKALAAGIVTLLNDQAQRRDMGEAGYVRVADKFGVDRLVEGTLAVYRRMRPSGPA